MKNNSLKVLMYHKVVSHKNELDVLSVTREQLKAHFTYLNQAGYNSISLSELIAYTEGKISLPENPVLVTFDDGYADNFHNMLPIAAACNIKTNIFIVPEFIRRNQQEFMSAEQLRSCNAATTEFGLHSYDHASYSSLSVNEVKNDLKKCFDWCKEEGITVQPSLAYPYGSFPKENDERKEAFFNALTEAGIRTAFRIGNRLNELPLTNKLLIQRLDIRGNQLMTDFVMKLKHGRVSPFRRLLRKFSKEPMPAFVESYRKFSLVLKQSVVTAQAHL